MEVAVQSSLDLLLAVMDAFQVPLLEAFLLLPLTGWRGGMADGAEFSEMKLEGLLLHEDVHEFTFALGVEHNKYIYWPPLNRLQDSLTSRCIFKAIG